MRELLSVTSWFRLCCLMLDYTLQTFFLICSHLPCQSVSVDRNTSFPNKAFILKTFAETCCGKLTDLQKFPYAREICSHCVLYGSCTRLKSYFISYVMSNKNTMRHSCPEGLWCCYTPIYWLNGNNCWFQCDTECENSVCRSISVFAPTPNQFENVYTQPNPVCEPQNPMKRCWRSAWCHLSSMVEQPGWSVDTLVLGKWGICTKYS